MAVAWSGRHDRAREAFAVIAGAAGGSIAIGAMEFFAARAAYPLMAIPFATSIVIVMQSPQAEPAQPRALIGGHLISTLTGLLAVKLLAPASWYGWHNVVARGPNKCDIWPTRWW